MRVSVQPAVFQAVWWYRFSNLVAIPSADFGSFLSNSLNKICILPPTCATDNLTCNCTIRVRCHVSRFWKIKQAIELELYSTYGATNNYGISIQAMPCFVWKEDKKVWPREWRNVDNLSMCVFIILSYFKRHSNPAFSRRFMSALDSLHLSLPPSLIAL